MEFLFAALGLVVGAGIAAGILVTLQSRRKKEDRSEAERVLAEAKKSAESLRAEAKDEQARRRETLERETNDRRAALKDDERRIQKKEDEADRRIAQLQTREKQVEAQAKTFETKTAETEAKALELDGLIREEKDALHKFSGLSKEDATKLLLGRLDEELVKEKADLIHKMQTGAKEEGEKRAREIITLAIQKFSAPHTAESTVSVVDLPAEDMKGRIIGREGRNIRAFEKATGIDVIIDDTPGVIILSGFDAVRREMAKRAMEKLVFDGRIHPTRIEEVVEMTKKEMEEHIIQTGKQFLYEMDIHNVHPKLITLLGRLKYRTSYGQNVLQHVKEVALCSQALAAEMRLDPVLARRCGVFHDIGKAIDMEMEGTHPAIGGELLTRFNESKEVIDAAAGHHSDMNAKYPYTVIAAAADAISASRPGARGETLEKHVKRLTQLEEIAARFGPVDTAYAIQAGRELRVLVNAGKVDDAGSTVLARDIANLIEKEVAYPGEVKVTVIRETRIVDYAR